MQRRRRRRRNIHNHCFVLQHSKYLHRQIFNMLFCPQNLSSVSSNDEICISGFLFRIYLKLTVKRATKACTLCCNIAAKRVEKRCCTCYHASVDTLSWGRGRWAVSQKRVMIQTNQALAGCENLLQRVVLFFNKHCKTGLLVVGGKLVQQTRHVSK